MATFLGPRAFILGTRFDHFLTKYFPKKKGPDPFDPVATKYYELGGETICIEQPTIAALQCIKNQLLTRSGCVYMGHSLYEFFQQFFGQKKVHKTQWKTYFSIKSKNIVFNAIFVPF